MIVDNGFIRQRTLSSPLTISTATHNLAAERGPALLRAALRQVAVEHRFLLALAAVYAAAGALLLARSVDGAVGLLLADFPLIIAGNGVIVASVAGIWTIGFLVRSRPAHPFAAVVHAFSQPDVWPLALARAIVLVPVTALVTGTFSAIKAEIPAIQAFSFDQAFIALDAALHAGRQPWELLQPVLGHPLVTDTIDRTYYLWFAILYHTFYWQIFTTRFPLLRLRFITAFMLSWILIGSAAAIALSSAGPVFLAGLGIDDAAFTDLFAYLRSVDETHSLFALRVQEWLWQAYAAGAPMPLKGISAMPSMHVAIAVLLALFGWRRHWLLGIGYTAFAVMIFLGSIHLGFHYAVDGYLAAAMVVAIWWVAERIARWSLRTSSAVPA
jgi:hypothetical protein